MVGRDHEPRTARRIPSWLIEVVSVVLILIGFGPVAAAALYWLVTGSLPPGAIEVVPIAALLVVGAGLFVWDRPRRKEERESGRRASVVAYSRMTLAFLALLVVAIVLSVAWPGGIQTTVLFYPVSGLVTAGIWGTIFSGWAYYQIRARTNA